MKSNLSSKKKVRQQTQISQLNYCLSVYCVITMKYIVVVVVYGLYTVNIRYTLKHRL